MKPLNQLDYPQKLGKSIRTIATIGCMLTVKTMKLNLSAGTDFTPPQINYLLNIHKGYAKDEHGEKTILNHIVFGQLFDLRFHDFIHCENDPAPVAKIINLLPLPIKVDYNPITDKREWHWVLGLKPINENKDIAIIDPVGGEKTTLLTKYGQSGWNLERVIFGAVIDSYVG